MAFKIIKAHGISSCIIRRQSRLVDVVAGTMSSLELLVHWYCKTRCYVSAHTQVTNEAFHAFLTTGDFATLASKGARHAYLPIDVPTRSFTCSLRSYYYHILNTVHKSFPQLVNESKGGALNSSTGNTPM